MLCSSSQFAFVYFVFLVSLASLSFYNALIKQARRDATPQQLHAHLRHAVVPVRSRNATRVRGLFRTPLNQFIAAIFKFQNRHFFYKKCVAETVMIRPRHAVGVPWHNLQRRCPYCYCYGTFLCLLCPPLSCLFMRKCFQLFTAYLQYPSASPV